MSRSSRRNTDALLERVERSAKVLSISDDRKMKIFMGMDQDPKKPSLPPKDPPTRYRERVPEDKPKDSRGKSSSVRSSSNTSSNKDNNSATRQQELEGVFGELDIDRSGSLSTSELFFVGQYVRGAADPPWTWEFNSRFIRELTGRHDGKVQRAEFVAHFSKILPQAHEEWRARICNLHEVAISVRGFYKAGVFEDELAKLKNKLGHNSMMELPRSPRSPRSRSSSLLLSPRSPPVQESERDRRAAALQLVYREFDLDGNGDVGFDELLVLGQTRRKLGQKSGEWTEEMNRSLMDKIGADSEDQISEGGFVKYFNGTLTHDPEGFDNTMEQFIECARACRKKKIQKRQAASQPDHAVQEAARQRAADEAARQRAADEAARQRAEASARKKADVEAAERRDREEQAASRRAKELEREQARLAEEAARLGREREAFERERRNWEQHKVGQERQLAQELRSELQGQAAAKQALESASQQRDRALRAAQERQTRLHKLVPLVQTVLRRHLALSPGESFRVWSKLWADAKHSNKTRQLRAELEHKQRELGALAAEASGQRKALEAEVAALRQEASRMEQQHQLALRVRSEEQQIAVCRMVAKALHSWRHRALRGALVPWRNNLFVAKLLQIQQHRLSSASELSRAAVLQRALLRLLRQHLHMCALGNLSVRLGALINLWARRAVAETCRTLEWRLSQAKQLMPEFVPEIMWEFQDTEHKWNQYSAESCLQLEVALANSPDTAVNIAEESGLYKVWLNARKHVDVMSGESRPCRRRAPAITFVTVAAGVRQYLINVADQEIGFRAGQDF